MVEDVYQDTSTYHEILTGFKNVVSDVNKKLSANHDVARTKQTTNIDRAKNREGSFR